RSACMRAHTGMLAKTLPTALVSFALLVCGACSSTLSPYARATAGRIGCPASRIEIEELARGERGPESWVAFCGSSHYVCSSNRAIANPDARIICSEPGRPPYSAYGRGRGAHAR
ncbi:MAG TPA: hypothetical protein VJR89_14645, partial [Polyangiales bacterium]|nr:hypothetical protein [Polyangiales bacterium]